MNFSGQEALADLDYSALYGEYTSFPEGVAINFGEEHLPVLEPYGYLILTQNKPTEE